LLRACGWSASAAATETNSLPQSQHATGECSSPSPLTRSRADELAIERLVYLDVEREFAAAMARD